MAFTIAIVGRPNVGKSTLFNRLVGRRLALVDDQPGVTRDRREETARLAELEFNLIDTAGIEDARPGSLQERMRAQSESAIETCDAVLFMFDARLGITADDEHLARLLRRFGKPVILLANKAETKAAQAGLSEAYSLGFGAPIAFSAAHGEGIDGLYEALRPMMPELRREDKDADKRASAAPEDMADDEAEPDRPIKIAFVGRPNAGKSTLVNRLLGADRVLTGPEAGITRDAISIPWRWRGREVELFDTAGIRKKSRGGEKLEKLSVADALRAIAFADVAVLLLDAASPFDKQDLHLADLIAREGRGIVIAVNKWDLVENPDAKRRLLEEECERLLPQLRGVPVVAVSAASGSGIDRLMRAVVKQHALWTTRISTGKLNRWFETALEANPPPAVGGRRIKLRFLTQATTRPPTFITFCSRPDAVPEHYIRYLINDLRRSFDLPGVPIRLFLREKQNPFDKD